MADPSFSETFASRLRTRRFGRDARFLDSVSSTNTAAAEWAAEGAAEGCLVAADYQTAGRGRLGRTWSAGAGRNLTFSLVLRPTIPAERVGLIPLAAALAVGEAVDRFVAPVPTRIRWPNDVLLGGRKACGMLLESAFGAGGTGLRYVVLGIGLNVNQVSFPDELADKATSLALEIRRTVDRVDVLAEVLLALEKWYAAAATPDTSAFRQMYTERMDGFGRPASFRMTEHSGEVSGVIRGITEAGALVLETDDGHRVFHAGELTSHGRGTR